ncbi:uncharacterized [Tachysurus ichikawai]
MSQRWVQGHRKGEVSFSLAIEKPKVHSGYSLQGASGQAGTGSFSESETQLLPATGSVLTRNLILMKSVEEKSKESKQKRIK